MKIRFLHSSDWQIGKVFRYVDDNTMALLQEARLEVIKRLGELAGKHGVRRVLVAGDVYDVQFPSSRLLRQPLERMRRFEKVEWHLLPGNHDPHRPNGLWDLLLSEGKPDNVHIHVNPGPVSLEEEDVVLLPAPLQYRRTFRDPTEYMDEAGSADGAARIGLAHGTVTHFGSEGKGAPNYISPDRPKRAGLSYLALGDWHGQKKINNYCWYSGSPEIDAFDVRNGGKALLVEIERPGVSPSITPLDTGHYQWLTLHKRINNNKDISSLERDLRTIGGDFIDRVLVSLKVEGALSLKDRWHFEQMIGALSAAFCWLSLKREGLFSNPAAEDFDQIPPGGSVGNTVKALRRKAAQGKDDERALANEALNRLCLEYKKLTANH